MKALRSLGFHDSVNERSESVQLFFNSSPKSGRPRTRSSTTVWNLPASVIVAILRGIHAKDLLSFRSVHSYFCDTIDSYQNSLWKAASFFNCWPEESNIRHFIKASACGNIEATIKLAVAYLYKEGLTREDVTKIASEAATYLSLAESLTPDTFPFFWIFIRPPWAPDGSCCKVQAFNYLKGIVDKSEDKDLAFGIALTLKLQRLSVPGLSKTEEQKYFNLAARRKSSAASFFTLLDAIPDEADTGYDYERIRLLRQLSSANILEARINLVRSYIQGHYGGITQTMAKDYAQHFFRSSKPSGIHSTFLKGPTSDISRYILVDWLVEVVGMKDFSAHTLYLAVSLFDRFLKMRSVQRNQVQLLGVAAMVISSRFLGFDILTIREAAWLTDNSYTYHDVVKMMGELVATLKGNIRMVTIQDYVKILLVMTGDGGYMAMLVEYIAMLCLLQSEMGQYSPAEVAASCVLLSRLLLDKDDPWPDCLKEWTGYSQDYLSLCTFHIHKKCVMEGSEVDYRDTKLRAVKLRYADSNRFSVSNIEVIGYRELSRRLGVTKLVHHGNDTKSMRFRNKDELLVSPRRLKKHPEFLRNLSRSFDEDVVDRTNAATPPIKYANNGFEGNVSGYDGDYEGDSDECMSEEDMYELAGDSTLDQSTAFDHFDESHDWDSEVSLMDDEPSDAENSSSLCQETGVKGDDKIVCLSSMCHSGNNVNYCQTARSSPSCCISNCSCQQNFTPIGPGSKKSLSSSSPSGRTLRSLRNTQNSSFSTSDLPSSSSSSVAFASSCISYVQHLSFSKISTNSSSAQSNIENHQSENSGRRRVVQKYCTSTLPSPSVCDTQPLKICDENENGNHAQDELGTSSNPSCSIAQTTTDSIHTPSACTSTADSGSMVTSTSQGSSGGLGMEPEWLKSPFVENRHSSHSPRNMVIKQSSSSSSSFIEISCPSTSSDWSTSPEKCKTKRIVSASSWQRNQLLCNDTGASGLERPFTSSSVCNLSEIPCSSNLETRPELMSPPNSSSLPLISRVRTYCNHTTCIGAVSSSYSSGTSSNSRSKPFSTETPSSHFMSVKRAKFGQSALPVQSPESHERPTNSRSCCSSFSDLLGSSRSHQATTGASSGGGGQYFTLPSRLKRKKATVI